MTFVEMSRALVEKPARSEFNDLPEGICAYSEVKLHGKAWKQIHP